MKLEDIILEKSQDFVTTPTGEDPERRIFSWKVEPAPIKSINNNLEKLYSDFQKLAKAHPNDEILKKYLDAFKTLKQGLRSHITKKYGK